MDFGQPAEFYEHEHEAANSDQNWHKNGSEKMDENFFPQNDTFEDFVGNTTSINNAGDLSLLYTGSELVVAILAIIGNALVVYVFCVNRPLRRYRNYYILSLAIADLLVGALGIPMAVLSAVGLPESRAGCLFSLSVLMVLCTISILSLVAVSVDRYWATTNPFAYYRNMTTTTSVGIILVCWFLGALIGFLPLFGWYHEFDGKCYFRQVMDYNYLVFLYFSTIVFPALLMLCFYGYIYHVVLTKIRGTGTLMGGLIRRASEASRCGSLDSGGVVRGSRHVVRNLATEKRREAKAAKKLGIIVLFFMISWFPLYTINCIQAFCKDCNVPLELMNLCIILSHANSALNPFLYAYHLKDWRLAMKTALWPLLCGLLGDLGPPPGGPGTAGLNEYSTTKEANANANAISASVTASSLNSTTHTRQIQISRSPMPIPVSKQQGQQQSPWGTPQNQGTQNQTQNRPLNNEVNELRLVNIVLESLKRSPTSQIS